MDIRDLPLDDLVLDPNLNLRDRLDDETVDRYLEAWDRKPPVTVFEVEGRWLLADGFHRHAAAVTAGRRTMKAEVRAGTFSDALDYVAGANLFHGLPLSRVERRRAIEIKLRLHHEKSDRTLASDLGVGRELVAKIRRQLIEGGQVPAGATRMGADGKVYPASLPRDRGAREADSAPWDDTTDPMPVVSKSTATAPWDVPDAKTTALAPPPTPAAPTIDEMLTLMTRQIMEVVTWTQAEGFGEAYRTAGGNARGLFQTSVIKLAARADQLRKG
jgi:ParB-like chromosome segregation protein Spo0J